jgi:hypothetical protein
MTTQQASWSILDEYTLAIRRVCERMDYELREIACEGDDPKTMRRFVAESRTQPFVEEEATYPWGQFYVSKKTMPHVEIQIAIHSTDPKTLSNPSEDDCLCMVHIPAKPRRNMQDYKIVFLLAYLKKLDNRERGWRKPRCQVSVHGYQQKVRSLIVASSRRSSKSFEIVS